MSRIRHLVIAAGAIVLALAMSVSAQVMQQVPSDAWAVFKVANLQKTNDKVASFIKATGLDQSILGMLVPKLDNPLSMAMNSSGITKGLDLSGELAMVWFEPVKQEAAVAQPADDADADTEEIKAEVDRTLMLVPVANYQEFLSNFTNVTVKDGVAEGTAPGKDNGKPAYIAQRGNYAAISAVRDLVAQHPANGIALSGLTQKQLESQDFVIYANIPAMRSKLLADLQKNRAQAIASALKEFDEATADQPDKAALRPVTEAGLNQLFDLLENALRDIQAASASVNLDDQGISSTSAVDFIPDSHFGQLIQKFQAHDEAFLTGLPNEKYLAVGGINLDPAVVSQLISEIVQPIIEAAKKIEDPQGEAMAGYLQTLSQIYANINIISAGMIAPTAPLGQGPLLQYATVLTGDITAIMEASEKFSQYQKVIGAQVANQQVQTDTTYVKDAKTVDGVSLDQFGVKLKADADADAEEARQAEEFFNTAFGKDGLIGYIGKVSDSVAVGVVGLSDEQLSAAIAAAKAGNSAVAGNSPLEQVSSKLPQQRIAGVFIFVDQIVNTVNHYASQAIHVNISLPPDLPPIGVVVSKDGASLRTDTLVSTPLLRSLITTGTQAAMQYMQGQHDND